MRKLLVASIALGLISLFATWFSDCEKRMDTASNVWRDIVQASPNSNIMFGSSTIRRFDADQLLDCGTWENRGIGTAGITNMAYYFSLPLKRWSPEWIVVYGGDNDVARDGLSATDTIALHKEFNETLFEQYPDAKLLLLEIKLAPKRAAHHETYRTINTALEKFAEQHENALYVSSDWDAKVNKDVFLEDGVHLNELGNQIMATSINEACRSPQQQ